LAKKNLSSFILKIFSEIHSGIHPGYLLGIAVEHQRFSFEEFSDTPFVRLAPTRMVNFRVDVRVKPYSFDADRFHEVGG